MAIFVGAYDEAIKGVAVAEQLTRLLEDMRLRGNDGVTVPFAFMPQSAADAVIVNNVITRNTDILLHPRRTTVEMNGGVFDAVVVDVLLTSENIRAISSRMKTAMAN